MAHVQKEISDQRSKGLKQRSATFGKNDKTNKQRRRAAKKDMQREGY